MQLIHNEPTPDTAGRRPLRAALTAVVVVLFASVATLGTIATFGAYCLTTDGGDGRALAAIRQLVSRRNGGGSPEGAVPASDARCPLPARHPEIDPMSLATTTPPLPAPAPSRAPAADRSRATAVFALGWFWGPDSRFGSLDGVLATRVGYAGGASPNPTYQDLGDHAEAIEVTFDPRRITYEQLLDELWASHDPTAGTWSRQYRSAVFPQDSVQLAAATASRERLRRHRGEAITTTIEPRASFHPAEDYHQKWALRRHPGLWQELQRVLPGRDDDELVRSTLAARLNAFVGRQSDAATLRRQLGELGLEPAVVERLLTAAR